MNFLSTVDPQLLGWDDHIQKKFPVYNVAKNCIKIPKRPTIGYPGHTINYKSSYA